MDPFNFSTYVYPTTLLILNGAVALLLVWRRISIE
jgi:hypothetical protein